MYNVADNLTPGSGVEVFELAKAIDYLKAALVVRGVVRDSNRRPWKRGRRRKRRGEGA